MPRRKKGAPPKKMGRPRIPDAMKRSLRLQVKFSPLERAALDKAARTEGVQVTKLVRKRALAS